jgi:hypothetical protein
MPRTGSPTINEAYRARYFSGYRPAQRSAAGVARLYGAVVHPPRPLLALLVLATLAALAMAAVSRGRYVVEPWPGCSRAWACDAHGLNRDVSFIVRYLVPGVPLIVCGGTVALVGLWRVRAGSGDHDRSRRTRRSART